MLFVESDATFQIGDIYIEMVKFTFYFHCCPLLGLIIDLFDFRFQDFAYIRTRHAFYRSL